MSVREAIVRAVEGHDLTEPEAAAAMKEIVDGQATPAQIAALLIALRMKGETVEEIAGLARVMRAYATPVPGLEDAIDVVGTGGDGAHSFNISTVSAFVVAAAGGKVAKHGNRGVTSACGAADFLQALGIAVELTPEQVDRSVRQAGFGFMFAPIFHPAMRHAVGPRREIGVRTAFNLLGPITNPAGVRRQLTGVAVPELAERIARALSLLGSERALVVHGTDGLDEISISAPTVGYLVEAGEVRQLEIDPTQFGLNYAPIESVRGGTIEANLRLADSVLAGERTPARDAILMNAGASLYVAGLAESMPAGAGLAAELLDSGKVAAQVAQIQRVSAELQADQAELAAP
jgi:anthranilate phosphoribosyltransferase